MVLGWFVTALVGRQRDVPRKQRLVADNTLLRMKLCYRAQATHFSLDKLSLVDGK